jgi:hypothetical protein
MINFNETLPVRILSLAGMLFGLTACGAQTEAPPTSAAPPAPAVTVAATAASCAGEQGLTYICGMQRPEDLLPLGSTGLLLVSGQRSPPTSTQGHMYLVDPVALTQVELIHNPDFRQQPDLALSPGCPGPLNLDVFAVHGLSIAETAPGIFNIYSTSHGEREAIEIYDLDLNGAAPILTWKSCVLLPQDAYFNGVARLADGGFITTRMRDAAQNPGALPPGSITGTLYEWHPGGTPFAIAGTEASLGNGLDISADERYVFVAASGTREIIRFDRSTTPPSKVAVVLPIGPDNIHWGLNGKLLTAGTNEEAGTGWSVFEVDPETLAFTRVGGADQSVVLQNVSAAMQVGSDIWAATASGDRIARFARE